MQPSTDFEVHPIGTGTELARLHDLVRDLQEIVDDVRPRLIKAVNILSAANQ
jgi:hypothetical protein